MIETHGGRRPSHSAASRLLLVGSIAAVLALGAGTVQAVELLIDAAGDPADPAAPLDLPRATVVDGADRVYVAGAGSDNVFEVVSGATVTEIINLEGAGVGQRLDSPSSLAADGAGSVYVAGSESDNAFEIATDGTISEIIDSTGDGGGNELDQPDALAIDSAGNVFVAGTVSDNVFRIAPSGMVSMVIDLFGAGTGAGLDAPVALAVDVNDNLFVASVGSDNVLRLAPDSTLTEMIDQTGDGAGAVLNNPRYLAVDGSGNLFVAGDQNVFKVTPVGVVSVFLSGIEASGLATDSVGRVFVATGAFGSTASVRRYESDGTGGELFLNQLGDLAGNLLVSPAGLSVDSTDAIIAAGLNSANAFRADGVLPPEALDTDGDGVSDADDNCPNDSNGPLSGPSAGSCTQADDTDNDGFGDACDPDFDQDDTVQFSDLLEFIMFQGSGSSLHDLDCADGVQFTDFLILISKLGSRPG